MKRHPSFVCSSARLNSDPRRICSEVAAVGRNCANSGGTGSATPSAGMRRSKKKMNAKRAAAKATSVHVFFQLISMSPPRPDEQANEKDRAGQSRQQDELHRTKLRLSHRDFVIAQLARRDSANQHGLIHQPVRR